MIQPPSYPSRRAALQLVFSPERSVSVGMAFQDDMDMTASAARNPDWGFWGTAKRNGYDPQIAWDVAADCLATAFRLNADEIRTLLDARFGRHLADDLSFIPGGPATPKAIERHVMDRLANRIWRSWFADAMSEAKAGAAESKEQTH